jgi:hypothetical protein
MIPQDKFVLPSCGDVVDEGSEFSLKINGYTPDTLPMERLAEYMAALAKLMGSQSSVHFVRVKEGSAVLVSHVGERDRPKVEKRLQLVKMNAGTADARLAYKKLDDMLLEDATDGVLLEKDNNVIIFPGKNREQPTVYKSVWQYDSVEGVLITIGGKDDTVPVHLESGNTVYKCTTTRGKAREMAPYLFSVPLRVSGEASWRRDANGTWCLNSLIIDDFKALNTDAASLVIDRLRKIEGNEWDQVEDPYALLRSLRDDDGDNK